MTDRAATVEQILNRITEHGGDLNAAFPNPFRFHKHKHGRRQAFYNWELAHLLTERDQDRPWGFDAEGSYFVVPNQRTISGFIEGRLNITTRRTTTGQARPPEYRTPASSIGGV